MVPRQNELLLLGVAQLGPVWLHHLQELHQLLSLGFYSTRAVIAVML
jgi:hypothetical protein